MITMRFQSIARNCLNVQIMSLFRISYERVSDLFNAKQIIFQLHHSENKLYFDEMMIMSALYETNTLSWIFRVLAY